MTPYSAGRLDPRQRVGDYERDITCGELNRHYGDGRLSSAELDARVDAAVAATTRQDLYDLLRDLPRLDPPALPAPSRTSGTAANLIIGFFGASAFICLVLLQLVTMAAYPTGAILVFLGALGASVSVLAAQHFNRVLTERNRAQDERAIQGRR